MDNKELEEEYDRVQKRVRLISIANELAKTCYDDCVYNFRMRSLNGLERDCINACSQKYYFTSLQVDEDLDQQPLKSYFDV